MVEKSKNTDDDTNEKGSFQNLLLQSSGQNSSIIMPPIQQSWQSSEVWE